MGEVVVSGATGLVGRRLVDALADEGTGVRALTRNPAAARFGERARAVAWDGREVTPETLAGADAVVHLAGEPVFGGPPTAKRRARMRESRMAVLAMGLLAVGGLGLGMLAPTAALLVLWVFTFSLGDHILFVVEGPLGLKLARDGAEGRRLGQLGAFQKP